MHSTVRKADPHEAKALAAFSGACFREAFGYLFPDEALDLLRIWNQGCTPSWPDEDLAGKVKHARAYGTGEFGSMLAKAKPRLIGGLLCFGWPQ